MTDKQTGGPAFPQDYEHTDVLVKMQQVGDISAEQLIKLSRQLSGMTLRDYFAAMAMQGIQSRVNWSIESIADLAYKQADAMLKAREQ